MNQQAAQTAVVALPQIHVQQISSLTSQAIPEQGNQPMSVDQLAEAEGHRPSVNLEQQIVENPCGPANDTTCVLITRSTQQIEIQSSDSLDLGMELDIEPAVAIVCPIWQDNYQPESAFLEPLESAAYDPPDPDAPCYHTSLFNHSYSRKMPQDYNDEPNFLLADIFTETEDGQLQPCEPTASSMRETQASTGPTKVDGISHPKKASVVDEQRVNEENDVHKLQEEIRKLRRQMAFIKKQVRGKSRRFSYKNIQFNDEKTRQFTGFPSYQCFYTIFEKRIKPRAERLATNHKKTNRPWYKTSHKKKPGPSRPLPLLDEFLLTMMRLRLDVLGFDLSDRFEISEKQVSTILNWWIPCLARCLRKLIKKPSKEQWKETMPDSFAEYPNTRTIIDCTEVFIERPTNLLARQQTWSTYKSHNTAKLLVGISPEGGITFLSKAWGGRSSDKHIVEESGFLDTLDPYDEIMADRGFDITGQLAEHSCRLNIPPFTRGKSRLSAGEVYKHRKISRLRIHVERAIERIKNFRILQGVFALKQIHLLNDILTVSAAVVNMWPPIVT